MRRQHSWTPFAVQEGKHRVVQTDLSRWDYKHPILESSRVPNWRVLLWVKFIEMVCQSRPKAWWRLLAHPDARFRAGMRWYSNIGRRVWPYEIWHWLFRDRRTANGPTLAEFLNGGWKMNFKARKKADAPGIVPPMPERGYEVTQGAFSSDKSKRQASLIVD